MGKYSDQLSATSSSPTGPSSASPPTTRKQQIALETPKIDAALKSYCSWFVATYNASLSETLQQTRILSQTINAARPTTTTTPPTTSDNDLTIVCELWQHVQASHQRVTHLLGRTALRTVWPQLPLPAADDDGPDAPFLQHFARLLFNNDEEDDAALIWGTERGTEELVRRATVRQQQAAQRVQQQQQRAAAAAMAAASSMVIEEIDEEDETEQTE